MKKLVCGALKSAVIINIAGVVINLITYIFSGRFLLAQQLSGGECIEWRGFGLLLRKIFAFGPVGAARGSTHILFDFPSLFICLFACFVLSLLVLSVMRLAEKS